MTRIEAMKMVEQIVRDFSADDVKFWLSEVCTVCAGEERRAGRTEECSNWMAVANDIAAVRNRGV